ncbi:MAG TPA: single-stranded-DNA-specific exonuclease RecJ [Solirubrobacterales bacterium]
MAETVNAYRADPYDYGEARALAEALDLSEPVAITLVRRGYRTPEQARAFLDAEESHPPSAFGSMEAVVGRLIDAVEAGRRVTVHGDFDVDGVCATTIMVGTLRELGAECDWLIPDRISDGYGLDAGNVRRLAERGTSLLITVDCGITAVEEVALAQSLGIEVIVTDHHQPGTELPDCPILHPAIDGYPFEELCGTAVSWKLATALREASGRGSPGRLTPGVPGDPPPDAPLDLDLVALATVADVVPLIGENRSIVRKGLSEIGRTGRPGMRALLKAASVEPTNVDEGDLAFRLAPRINAAGRLYRADAGVELFLTEDASRAAEIAAELSRANGERRATEREVDAAAEAARRELPVEIRDAPAIVVAGEGWHPGVVGIVASRLAERHHRPAIVISLDGDGNGRGSGRSIPGFDLLAALEACSSHLTSFGGHRAAAGLELPAAAIEGFREAFCAHAGTLLGPEDLVRTVQIDAMIGGAGIGLDLAEELERLAPFGMGNPGVRLLVPSARVEDVRAMGEGKHSRFSLHSGSHRAAAVAFGRSGLGVEEGDPIDAAVRLEVNRWNGSVEPRVVLGELYPRAVDPAPDQLAAEWWRRFEAELHRDLGEWSLPEIEAGEGPLRTELRTANSGAAMVAELASSGCGEVLAAVADTERRAPLAREGVPLVDVFSLEAEPEIARRFEHVVLVDPPACGRAADLLALPGAGGGYLHLAWGETERRFCVDVVDQHLAGRAALISVFRALRETGDCDGGQLREALAGRGTEIRRPEAAARCFRVLRELGLVQGSPDSGDGTVGVVSSAETELERSRSFRAYSARYKECLRFLERHRHR